MAAVQIATRPHWPALGAHEHVPLRMRCCQVLWLSGQSLCCVVLSSLRAALAAEPRCAMASAALACSLPTGQQGCVGQLELPG